MTVSEPILAGKTVAVAGAGGRLGRVVVHHLVEAGADVHALDQHLPPVMPPGVVGHLVNLTDEASVTEAFAALGPLDALIHVVGMWVGQSLAETSLGDWDAVLRVNLTSPFLCFREAVRAMAGRDGRLLAIAAKQGADRGVAQQAAYSASKAGVVRLVEAVGHEYAGTGITATALAPSMLLFGGEEPGTLGVTAQDLAALCVYLCTPAGAAHNGATLRAYGTLL